MTPYVTIKQPGPGRFRPNANGVETSVLPDPSLNYGKQKNRPESLLYLHRLISELEYNEKKLAGFEPSGQGSGFVAVTGRLLPAA